MGYYMHTMESFFSFQEGKEPEAFQAIIDLFQSPNLIATYGYGTGANAHLSWITTPNVLKSTNIIEALNTVRWKYDPSSHTLDFIGENLGEDLLIFNFIAPYVTPGSYVQMSGADGTIWRWIFKDQKCVEVTATVNFD